MVVASSKHKNSSTKNHSTSEFDKSGFAAVDAFFGSDAAEIPETVSESQNHAPQKRLGVGANRQQQNDKLKGRTVEAASQSILKVGEKRQRRQHEEEEEAQSSDDDEDLGRTAIESSSKSAKAVSIVPETKPKKRKMGKKERALQQQQQQSNSAAAESETKPALAPTNHHGTPSNNSNQPSTKRKRKKVRSKQKNIYKDKRGAQKPQHLIPGSRNYKGRPLTAETRVKLGMPPSRSSVLRSNWTNQYNNNDKEAAEE